MYKLETDIMYKSLLETIISDQEKFSKKSKYWLFETSQNIDARLKVEVMTPFVDIAKVILTENKYNDYACICQFNNMMSKMVAEIVLDSPLLHIRTQVVQGELLYNYIMSGMRILGSINNNKELSNLVANYHIEGNYHIEENSKNIVLDYRYQKIKDEELLEGSI
jgi:hypothetical protein